MQARATERDNRDQLLATFVKAQSITDGLFRVVNTKTLYDRPIPERHRIVFYVGHIEAFDWNLIGHQVLGLEPADREFDRLFAFGIDPVGGGLPTDQPSDWPRLPEIGAYSLGIRQELDKILRDKSQDFTRRWQYPRDTILNVAIEHRLMHAETLAYMLHQLPVERKIPPPGYSRVSSSAPAVPIPETMIDIPAGDVTLGIPRGREAFGWDNEFDVHSVHVPAFAIDSRKVTNGEFLNFMRKGGYQNQRLWSEAGWAWVQEHGVTHPHFWFERQGLWFYRTMFEEVPLPLDWPVYVSHAEAFCLCAVCGQAPSHRSPVSSGGIRHAAGSGAGISLGRRTSRRSERQLQFSALGSD